MRNQLTNCYASVATVRQRSNGLWQVQPPEQSAPRLFDSKQDAIKWATSQGWGIHLLNPKLKFSI